MLTFNLKNAPAGCYTESLTMSSDPPWDGVTPPVSSPTDPFCKP